MRFRYGGDLEDVTNDILAVLKFNLIKNIIDTHKIYALDFDVEGSQLGVTSLNDLRNKVIKRLQASYPNLYVSFTLPVDPAGLPAAAVNLVRAANTAGVRVSVVNIMAMDYGAQASAGKTMGNLALAAANATFAQIKGIFSGRTDAQLWAMIGITPMIGTNDVTSEVFRQTDAQQVAAFAKQKKLGLLAYWAIQRDQPGTGSLDNFSQVNTKPYEFYQILATAGTNGGTPPAGGVSDGRYTLSAVYSSKCIDVAAASLNDGANVQQYHCNGTGAQKFDLTYMGSGWYRILNANSGKSLDVASASLGDGANIQQWSDNGSGAQRFAIKATAVATEFTIENQASGKCVDIVDWSTADGGNIQQWACSGGQNQKFRFTK